MLCRPDLLRKTWVGGLLFLGFYMVFLLGLKWSAPGYIEEAWNPRLTEETDSAKEDNIVDQAVALVQAYLRVNGHFTVSEHPVIVPAESGGYRTATDLDILAFRFPGAGALSPQGSPLTAPDEVIAPDPALGIHPNHSDMLIGEVREGRAELNGTATDPSVLRAVLTRFGCCPPEAAHQAVHQLQRRGHVTLPNGQVRLAAFGSTLEGGQGERYSRMALGHVLQFREDYLDRHWASLRVEESKDPTFGFLILQAKAKRGLR